MLRSLIRLYLIVLLTGGAVIVFVNVSFDYFFHDRVTAKVRERTSVYAFVLTDYLERHPGAQRAAALAELQKHRDNDFSVLTLQDVVPLLDAPRLHDLRDGKLVLDRDATDYYLPLPNGTIVRAAVNDREDLDIKMLAFVLLALATLLSVMVWVHYHWRDLRALESAARAFGSGNLAARARLPGRSNIDQLAQQFNQMAQQIEASIQHQRDMMHGISHELKTPLARLEFGLALLQAPDSVERQRARQLALRKDVRELDELVTEMLTLSRLEQGEGHRVLMRCALGELLDSVAASMANDIADRTLSLSVTTAGAPAHHVCDPKLVARALLNLIRNSTRYAHRAISLNATTGPAGALVLTVEDDGPGIPVAEWARVFEPFHRVDSSRNRHTGGFGLGLTIVRRVALVHGGTVRLEASETGGARFVMTLPRLALPASAVASAAASLPA
ncbi:ATP-binding protein [Paraburkholderia phenazinium]|jgi:two-component system OmpR family sensor kinase|uniref:histidine kinase n=1 Tax=Paraburkholderia phenazinium TaxID=60549 RepID=A0A1G8LU96_9BURK|nr:ATP-binding protein [Paraburkholderia phenazinium]SDI59226.1 two-component system, OmpR family, sensor kinase [Paraburkholderia phenazinium]